MCLAVIVLPAPGGMQAITLLCDASSFLNSATSVSWYGRNVGISIIFPSPSHHEINRIEVFSVLVAKSLYRFHL
jgi:hypothetical protein